MTTEYGRSFSGKRDGDQMAQEGIPFFPGTTFTNPRDMRRPKAQLLVARTDSRHDRNSAYGVEEVDDQQLFETMSKSASWRLDTTSPSPTHDERRAFKASLRNSYRPTIMPAWLKHDRQVLRFFAYFQEPVHESPIENFRVRNCVINFFLEDGTLQINEPKVENSGLTEGCLLKRHRAIKPDDSGPLEVEDFRLGSEMYLCGHKMRITDCDDFTKWFYNESGLELGEPEPSRSDDFFEKEATRRAALGTQRVLPKEVLESKEYTEVMLGGSRRNVGLRQHLNNSGKVLRLYAYWDDKTRHGTRMYLQIHFFLQDDSIEILERHSANSGRDPFPVFLRRQRLRHEPEITACPGMLESELSPKYFTPEDFIVGSDVKIYGRLIHLYDCDAYTRSFYREHLEIEQEAEVVHEEVAGVAKLSSPPPTGYGSEADSMTSCVSLNPQPPKKDLARLYALSDVMLRFEAVMVNPCKEDEARRFIVGMRLADFAVGVWETRSRNSGRTEGKFAELGQKIDPKTGAPYSKDEFFVGNVVTVSAVPLLLVKADDYTLKYMESHPREFPQSDIRRVASRIAPTLESAGFQSVAVGELKTNPSISPPMTEHEIVTLLRRIQPSGWEEGDDAVQIPVPEITRLV